MRAILFRGKRVDNGEWVYGDLLQNIDAIKIREQEKEIKRIAKSFEVSIETLGQFTGLVDKNGMKIFEGDIVKLSVLGNRNHKRYEVFYDVETGQRLMKNGDGINDCENLTGVFARADCEVIGNIYDNPELLGGEDV